MANQNLQRLIFFISNLTHFSMYYVLLKYFFSKIYQNILESYFFSLLHSIFPTNIFDFSTKSFLFILWTVLFCFLPIMEKCSFNIIQTVLSLKCVSRCFIERSSKSLRSPPYRIRIISVIWKWLEMLKNIHIFILQKKRGGRNCLL